MSYKNILNRPMAEYNAIYKRIWKLKPYLSIDEKKYTAFSYMFIQRGIDMTKLGIMAATGRAFSQHDFIAELEVGAVSKDIAEGIDRYYVKDDSLFDFFRQTPVKDKEVQAVLDSFNKEHDMDMWGVIGQNFSCTIIRTMDPNGKTVLLF